MGRKTAAMKSKFRRALERNMEKLDRRIDNGKSNDRRGINGVVHRDMRKQQPELNKVYSQPVKIKPLKAVPLCAIKKSAELCKILIDLPATADKKAGKARVTIGWRIYMMDGSSWLYHFKFQTWSRKGADGRKDSFGKTKYMLRQMGHCKPLVSTLLAELNTIETGESHGKEESR